MGEREMTPDHVLCGFLAKVGLRIGWGDEGRVWGRGREGALRDTLFGAAEDGAEDGDEEVPAFLGEGIAKGAVCDAGWDGLQGKDGWISVLSTFGQKTLKSSYDGNAS
jgi:hypothetical protein